MSCLSAASRSVRLKIEQVVGHRQRLARDEVHADLPRADLVDQGVDVQLHSSQ